jgi:hypothetical protein
MVSRSKSRSARSRAYDDSDDEDRYNETYDDDDDGDDRCEFTPRMVVTIVLEMATRCILLLVSNLTLLHAIRNEATADGAPIDQTAPSFQYIKRNRIGRAKFIITRNKQRNRRFVPPTWRGFDK